MNKSYKTWLDHNEFKVYLTVMPKPDRKPYSKRVVPVVGYRDGRDDPIYILRVTASHMSNSTTSISPRPAYLSFKRDKYNIQNIYKK